MFDSQVMRGEIIKLLADCADASGGDLLHGRDPHAYVEKILKSAEVLTWHQGGSLRALVAFYANDPEGKLAFVTLLAVGPDHQGKGVARSMLTSCLSIVSTRGFRKCRLEVAIGNERALRFYNSLGFIEVTRNQRVFILEMDLKAAISGARV